MIALSTASEPPETKNTLSRPSGISEAVFAASVFGRLVFEMQAIGEGRLFHLPAHRLKHVLVAVADIGDHRAAGTVEIALAVDVEDVDAFRPVDEGTAQARLVEEMRGGFFRHRRNPKEAGGRSLIGDCRAARAGKG